MDITPEQLNEWTQVIWSAGWKMLLVFTIIYYRDLVTKVIGTFVEIIASWIKQK